jgi:hypothetical protein
LLEFVAYETPKQNKGWLMTAFEGIPDAVADTCFGIAASWAKPDNIWVETAWMVLAAANELGDAATIEACQRVVDDDAGGELPAQSDMNTIFVFLDAHAH